MNLIKRIPAQIAQMVRVLSRNFELIETEINGNSGIVESGSNANGSYVKWANGLMVCHKYQFLDGTTVVPAGATAGYTWTFPQVFSAVPAVFTTWGLASDNVHLVTVGVNMSGAYLLTDSARIAVHNNHTGDLQPKVNVFAIGTWS